MKIDDRTGWYEQEGEWYLYHKGRVLGEFYITHSDPPKMMHNIRVLGKMVEETILPSGDVNEAKSMIENEIIGYCADMIAYFSGIRYTVVKAAGERTDKHDIEM